MGIELRPTKDRILVERIDQGREVVTSGGIILPATTQGRHKTKSDTFRARVLAVGPKAPVELEPGVEVLVYTWADGDGSTLYTGVEVGAHRVFVRPDDVVCIVEGDARAA